jgi:pimeloyl-ACP methyl ester carboxylesterase
MIAKMDGVLPGLFRAKLIDDCGHWTQQEAPEIVNQSLLDFMNHIMAL